MALISVQLYSLRNAGSLNHQLELVSDSGLSTVELTSANFDDLGETHRLLQKFGMAAPSGHVGMDRLRGDFDDFALNAKRIGIETLVLWGFEENDLGPKGSRWDEAGRELGRIADRLAAHGMRFAFHNHDWELRPVNGGGSALDRLFTSSTNSFLRWQIDCAWLARAGADVIGLLNQYKGLIYSAHVKDLAPVGSALDEDGWANLGQGTLPWNTWWPRLVAAGVEHFVLEHDAPKDPARFLKVSADAARLLARNNGTVIT